MLKVIILKIIINIFIKVTPIKLNIKSIYFLFFIFFFFIFICFMFFL